eukprot:COSAG05_NODE_23567_length_257_cov_0.651899_1_plen_85_part_11
MAGTTWMRCGEAVLVAFVCATVFFWIPAGFSCSTIPPASGGETCATDNVGKVHEIGRALDRKLYQAFTCPPGQYNAMATLSFTGQ